ncbi:MAG TPA: LLM class flavin-dependent oxidoreductase [Dehalococcoidia bacterium]
MTFKPDRMKFGIFMAPFHRVGENPTLAFERDMALIEHLDRLDFDEAWIGEHHSGARELIGEPMLFIAAAAQRTHKIKLGTGVTSLPYHHPFMVADRLVQLDHMTRGRAMLGVGPGLLTSDAYQLGIPTTEQRPRMNEALDAIMALLAGETVSAETEWFKLKDARLQLAPYTKPRPHIAVATSFTPSGPGAAGRHGLGLLSVAGADDERFNRTWGWVEEAAEQAGATVSRGDWKVVVTFHLAETREQALEDLRHSYPLRAYAGDALRPGSGIGGIGPQGATVEEAVTNGLLAGTPDDLIAKIEEIQERSGGVGGILALAHEWANTAATFRSYELFARYVMPRFQGALNPLYANREWFETNMGTIFAGSGAATVRAFADAGKELPPEFVKQQEEIRKRREAREAALKAGD